MTQRIITYFTLGFSYLMAHRQVALVILLLFFIPLAFLWTGQQFLSVAEYHIERLEKDRIGTMHDAIALVLDVAPLATSTLTPSLQNYVEQNPDTARVALYSQSMDGFSAEVTIGEPFDLQVYTDVIRLAAVRVDESIIFEDNQRGLRHWIGVRAIAPNGGVPQLFLVTDTSMEALDTFLAQKIRAAYGSLFVVIVLILALLWRQVRLVDYARLYSELQKAHETMSLFVNMTAHELRTPLTAIKGYASMIREDDTVASTHRSYAERIEESSNALITLISDLLDLARLQSGKLSFATERIDMVEVLLSTIELVRPLAQAKGLGLKTDFAHEVSHTVNADKKRMTQVFTNILSNSIKYTKEGNVTIGVNQVSKRLEIRVKDTGMGISADDQKRLFAPYFRVASVDVEKTTGTGLGMWITKRMIEEMGGTIDVESIKGVGTHIVLTFALSV
jgi:signal transduction histidine kinase